MFHFFFRTTIKCNLLLLIIILLAACGPQKDLTDLEYFVSSQQAIQQSPVITSVMTTHDTLFSYTIDTSLRSPFASPLPEKEIQPVTLNTAIPSLPQTKREKNALESFPLSAFKMVGTLKNQHGHYWGLVHVNQQLYRVKIGDYLGKNNGKIIGIKNKQIKVEEVVLTNNQWITQQKTIFLTVKN